VQLVIPFGCQTLFQSVIPVFHFQFGKQVKLLGAKSGKQGGWGPNFAAMWHIIKFSAKIGFSSGYTELHIKPDVNTARFYHPLETK
jgi:hypothetical protein